MEKLTFYTRLNCHLCEEAYRLLVMVALDIPLEIDVIDITHNHNEAIRAVYAHRIPVISKSGAGTELAWPFTADDLRAYLHHR